MPATVENLAAIIETNTPPQVTPDTPKTVAAKTMTSFGECGAHTVGLSYFQGRSAWSRHPHGDELFIVLQGNLQLITCDEAEEHKLDAGPSSLIRIPSGVWHSLIAEKPVAKVFLTVAEGTESRVDRPAFD